MINEMDSLATYCNTLLREAGCVSRWQFDDDSTSNSIGTWFCKDLGGVSDPMSMRQHTHNLLKTKEHYPDCAV